MNTSTAQDRLSYLAGYLATRKAKIVKLAGVPTLSLWSHSTELSVRLLEDYGGGLVERQGYFVWSLAGKAAANLLNSLLPIWDAITPEFADRIRSEVL